MIQKLGMDKLLWVYSAWDKESTTDDLINDVKTIDDNDDEDNADDIDGVFDCKHDENNNEDNTLAVVKEVCSENEDQVS